MRAFIFSILFFSLLYSDEYNRLLNLQYISKDAGIKTLYKSTTNEHLGVDLFSGISSGDILIRDNGTQYSFILDDEWQRIIYSQKGSDWIKKYGSF